MPKRSQYSHCPGVTSSLQALHRRTGGGAGLADRLMMNQLNESNTTMSAHAKGEVVCQVTVSNMFQ